MSELAQAWVRDGFVHLPGAASRALLDPALARIHRWMARGMRPERAGEYRQRSACPEERDHPDFMALFLNNSAIQETLNALLTSFRTPCHAQIALRFPELASHEPTPHLDGMAAPGNGVPPGELRPFAALVGLYLEPVPTEQRGNLTVWPGSHRSHGRHFATHGPESLLRGMPPLQDARSRQLTGEAGDAFVCHYLLGHGVAPNLGPRIRYAVYFRVQHGEHESLAVQAMADPFLGHTDRVRRWAAALPAEPLSERVG